MFADAVDHALLAEDIDNALRLIEEIAGASIWASGELPVLLNWSKRLPEDALTTRPQLCLYCARALFFNGQVEMADRYLQAAESALKMRRQMGDAADELHGVLYTNQATVRAMHGDSDRALELANRATILIPETEVSTRARIAHAIGTAQYLKGQVREAEAAFSEAIQLSQQANNRNLRLDVIACLALTQILSGKLGEAEHLCQRGLNRELQKQSVPANCAIFYSLALIDYERDELLHAREKIETAIELAQKASWLHVLWQAHLLQSQVWQALGDSQNARQALRQAEEVALRYRIPRVARIIAACQASLALAENDLEPAVSWAKRYEHHSAVEDLGDFEELTLARVFFVRGDIAQALSRVDSTLGKAEVAGRMETVIEAHILKAQLLEAAGDPEAGLGLIGEAIELAESEGFVRPFLKEGKRVKDLLLQLRQKKIPAHIMSYCARLLEGFGETISSSRDCLPDGLVEPLSEREMEVLQLISDGLSNPEIAERLYVSVNTLRAHTSHIFQKLAVHNRMQAVNRARQIGLLAPE
jgi:LuxR family maltose regulon positive regulatory protein